VFSTCSPQSARFSLVKHMAAHAQWTNVLATAGDASIAASSLRYIGMHFEAVARVFDGDESDVARHLFARVIADGVVDPLVRAHLFDSTTTSEAEARVEYCAVVAHVYQEGAEHTAAAVEYLEMAKRYMPDALHPATVRPGIR